MKNTFEEYVTNWWKNLLEEFDENNDNDLSDIYELLEINPEDSDVAELSAEEIYHYFFGYGCEIQHEQILELIPDFPTTEEFLRGMFQEADTYCDYEDFSDEFIDSFVYHAAGYESSPLGFFQDLRHGCKSGMIGEFVYSDDCKKFYIEHIDSLEAFKAELEDENDERIINTDNLLHYVFMCWLCYEEYAYNIARNLFPEEF